VNRSLVATAVTEFSCLTHNPGIRARIPRAKFEAGMEEMKKLAFVAAIIALSLLSDPGTESVAQTWPQRTVKLIVPLGPTSGADVTARLLADRLTKRWAKAVVVENRPGADGIVGITAFLGGPPDDHLLLFAPTGTFTAHPFLHEKLSYDPDELVPIARVTNTLIAITVPTALKVNSLADFMSFVRSQPGRYHWASVTGATDLVFSGFLKGTGVDMVRVPYRDSVLALNDLSEARIEVFLSALATVLPQVAGGKIKVLALTNHQRAPAIPEVPTVMEAGYRALQFDGLVGLFATSAMPIELREQIAGEVRAILADPAVATRIAGTGQIVSPGTPSEFANSIAEQRASFAAIAKALDMRSKR
jgi:tripartite-type tricarboxylate transporter receptor subunit TctC